MPSLSESSSHAVYGCYTKYVIFLVYITLAKHDMTEFYNLAGCTLWTDIAESPNKHLFKMLQLDSDYCLEEPSHMKFDVVDAWLRHWLELQKKCKHPLVLKGGLDNSSKICATMESTLPIPEK